MRRQNQQNQSDLWFGFSFNLHGSYISLMALQNKKVSSHYNTVSAAEYNYTCISFIELHKLDGLATRGVQISTMLMSSW